MHDREMREVAIFVMSDLTEDGSRGISVESNPIMPTRCYRICRRIRPFAKVAEIKPYKFFAIWVIIGAADLAQHIFKVGQ